MGKAEEARAHIAEAHMPAKWKEEAMLVLDAALAEGRREALAPLFAKYGRPNDMDALGGPACGCGRFGAWEDGTCGATRAECLADMVFRTIEEAREEAHTKGLLDARDRYAQAWVNATGLSIQSVEFTTENLPRLIGTVHEHGYDAGLADAGDDEAVAKAREEGRLAAYDCAERTTRVEARREALEEAISVSDEYSKVRIRDLMNKPEGDAPRQCADCHTAVHGNARQHLVCAQCDTVERTWETFGCQYQGEECALCDGEKRADEAIVGGDPSGRIHAFAEGVAAGGRQAHALEVIIEVQRGQIARHQEQIKKMIAAAKRLERTLLVAPDFSMASVDDDLAYLLCPEWPGTEEDQRRLVTDVEALLDKIAEALDDD